MSHIHLNTPETSSIDHACIWSGSIDSQWNWLQLILVVKTELLRFSLSFCLSVFVRQWIQPYSLKFQADLLTSALKLHLCVLL